MPQSHTNQNQNAYAAVRIDCEIDVIIFAKEQDANEFCRLHPEYLVSASGIYNSVQEALDIFGGDMTPLVG